MSNMHEHIKEFWPKSFAIAHYEKHIAWCKCKIAVLNERESLHTEVRLLLGIRGRLIVVLRG